MTCHMWRQDRDILISSIVEPAGSQGNVKPLGTIPSHGYTTTYLRHISHNGIKVCRMSFLASYLSIVINGHQHGKNKQAV
jgi:hypothetical protein